MNLWNNIFGRKIKPIINRPYPEFNLKILFLKRLHRSNPKDTFNGNTFVQKQFEKGLNNLDREISNNLNNGLIKISDYKDNLSNEFIIKELKQILRTKKLKLAGKKEELVNRVFANFRKDEINNPKVDLRKFSLTSKGQEIVRNDKKRFNLELDKFEYKIFNLLFKKEYEQAFELVSDFYNSYPYPLGMGTDWSRGFSSRDKEAAIKLRQGNLDLCKLELNYTELESVKTWLSTYSLFSSNYFRKFNIEKYILEIAPEFSCSEIISYLETKPKDSFPLWDKYDKKDEIEFFARHYYFKTLSEINLKELLKSDNPMAKRLNIDGIAIYGGRENCHLCEKGTLEVYKWNEINKIPKLPKYPGCSCFYGIHRKNEND